MKMLKKLLMIAALTLCVTPAWAQIPSNGGSSAIAPSGAAGGDLGGSYPNPTVTGGSHLGAGTVPNAALVTTPITSCTGGSAVSNQFLSAVSAGCAATLSQPAFTNLSGSAAAAQMPALTGDTTMTAGTTATTTSGGSNLSGVIGKINAQGTIGSGGTLSCDLSLGNICQATVGGGAFTIAKPTNGVANAIYYLMITSTADVVGTYATGWLQISVGNTLILPTTYVSGPNLAIELQPFYYDGTNYQLTNTPNVYARRIAAQSIVSPIANTTQNIATTSGAHSSTTGPIGTTAGGIISATGGTAPTITCSGGSTGSSIATGSTNNKGQAVTSSSASTNCTITWSAAATWAQAPFCVFADGAASITPTSVSTGTCGTATCVFDFASATSKTFNYVCL